MKYSPCGEVLLNECLHCTHKTSYKENSKSKNKYTVRCDVKFFTYLTIIM